MTIAVETPAAPLGGAVIEVALNRLKASPKNARKVAHSTAVIEARAASIAAKGLLQPLVVEPESDEAGTETGFYLVTIGEGRRQALRLLAKRRTIKKTDPVRCIVDVVNDPQEISLDENISRNDMHPADQFEAFRDLNERRGWGAEEIAARFGVSPQTVRQRLRLGAIAPRLMALYREDALTLDQLMAFAVSEDHARQEQVLEQYGSDRPGYFIRRVMTEAKVVATDRRARFVGVEAYVEAGGTVLRDLFTEDGGGWFEDVGLLDRMVAEKLAAEAAAIGEAEGWKWVEASLDYPRSEGMARVYPRAVERTAEEVARTTALGEEYDALFAEWDAAEEFPPEFRARLDEIEAALAAFGDAYAYDPEEIARGGVYVLLGHDGVPRVERGLIRPEDIPAPDPVISADDEDGGAPEPPPEETVEDETAPLSDRLVLDLTAHRTMGLRAALGGEPTVALVAVTHALALAAFYPGARAGCLEIKPTSTYLRAHAPGIEDRAAAKTVDARHAAWAARLPKAAAEVWGVVNGLSAGDLLELLAHCASLSVNGLRVPFDRKPLVLDHADALAQAVSLDMTASWSATQDSYFGRVTKARIAEAVGEAVSAEAAERIGGLKKPDMAREAEAQVAGTGWLPSLLRTPVAAPAEVASEGVEAAQAA